LHKSGNFKSAKKLGSASRKFTNCRSANHKKEWVRKSQIAKRHSIGTSVNLKKSFKPANVRILNLKDLFADRPLQ